MTVKNVRIELRGSEGIFRTEKNLSLFVTHETTVSVKEKFAALRKEVVKFLKDGELMIDLFSMDENCRSTSEVRMIPVSRDWRDAHELDYRKFNGYDFSDKELYKFVDNKSLVKYVMKEIEKFVSETMGELPENESWFSRKLNGEYIPEEILVHC